MKVAVVVCQWPVDGGIETVTRTLANEMVRRRHQVYVLYTEYNFPLSSGVYVDNRIVEVLIPEVSCCSKDEMFRKGIVFINELNNKEKFDVIINQCYPTWSSAVLKDLKGHVKVIECFHMLLFGPSRYKRLKWNGWDLKMRLCGPWIFNMVEKIHLSKEYEREFQNVDKLVLLAEAYVKEYRRIRGNKYTQGKLTYMHNPLAQNVIMTEKDFQSKENIVLCVSRMCEDVKRISHMIEMWEKIEDDYRFADWRFDLVGDGPSLSSYRELVHRMGLKRVSFWGYQNPERFYRKSKILLMTSAFEGLPMTIPEAQQCGVVPIVLNTFSSVHELIVDGYNGRIASNKRKFLHCLRKMMLQKDEWEKMAQMGMITCKQFAVTNIVDKWEELICSI